METYVDAMLRIGEKLFSEAARPVLPMRLGAAHEYRARFLEMSRAIKEDLLARVFVVGSGGRISLQQWVAVCTNRTAPTGNNTNLQAALDGNESVKLFLNPYEPLKTIVDGAVIEIHGELTLRDQSPRVRSPAACRPSARDAHLHHPSIPTTHRSTLNLTREAHNNKAPSPRGCTYSSSRDLASPQPSLRSGVGAVKSGNISQVPKIAPPHSPPTRGADGQQLAPRDGRRGAWRWWRTRRS